MLETIVEDHRTGEKRVLPGQLPTPACTPYKHVAGLAKGSRVAVIPPQDFETIAAAAHAIAGKKAEDVPKILEKTFKKPRKPPEKPAPPQAPTAISSESMQMLYCMAILRKESHGRFEFGGMNLEDVKDIVVGMRVEFMPYSEWIVARGYVKKNASAT